jgi:calcium-dependent protein kinase
MAPEVVKRRYDEKCDIWSTGVMTFVLLTGKPLYKLKRVNMIYQNVN